jgi:hypothetical protein
MARAVGSVNFLCDANISPHLARALNALSVPDGHSVQHLTEKFSADTPDIEWVQLLSVEGGWAVVTQDRAMARNPIEQEALRRSGLTVFMLGRAWNSQRQWDKAAALVRWWPRIVEQALLVAGGAAFEVPWGYSSKKRLRQIRI